MKKPSAYYVRFQEVSQLILKFSPSLGMIRAKIRELEQK